MHSQETNQKPENMLETDASEADAPVSDVKEEGAKERTTRRSENVSISSILDKRKGEEESLSTQKSTVADSPSKDASSSLQEETADDLQRPSTSPDATKDLALTKLQDSFKETRKWGLDLSNKLHAFEKKVHAFLEDGVLTKEEATSLLKEAQHQDIEKAHPLVSYSKIWDEEIHNIKKYTKDETVDQNILAFQHLLKHADQEEMESILEELVKVEKDPLDLTHKMLQMGKDYHASTYGPLTQAGGMQNLLKIHQKERQKLQQQVDKLSQELVKLKRSSETSSRLDTAGYSLPDGGSFGEIKGDALSLGGILKKGLSGR